MQTQKYPLIVIISILISICSAQSKYCGAQVKQSDLYLEFEQLVQDKQKAKAIEIGHDLFGSLVSKYPENINLNDLQRKLESTHYKRWGILMKENISDLKRWSI